MTEDKNKITLIDALKFELNEAIKESTLLSEKAKQAKTKPKRELYSRKLEKNNQYVFEIVLSLQRLRLQEEAKNEK